MKPCEHYKSSLAVHTSSIKSSQSQNHDGTGPWKLWIYDTPDVNWGVVGSGSSYVYSYPYGTASNPSYGLPSICDSDKLGTSCLVPTDKSDLVDQALLAMLPGIRPKLSLLNTIFELKDIKSMSRSYERARVLGHRISRYLTQNYRWNRWDLRTLRRLTGLGSDGFLQWKFNLAPLVSDLLAVRAAGRNIVTQVENLLRDEGKLKTRHFKRVLVDTYPDSDNESYDSGALPFGIDARLKYRRYVTHSIREFNATIAYVYYLRNWERENAPLLGFLDALGVNFNPAILWNAVPYTFIIDWFANIGSFLSRYTIRNIEPVTDIRGFCWSVRVKRIVRTTYQSYGSPYPTNGPEVPVATLIEDSYLRVPETPLLNNALQLSGLNSSEFSLSAALIGSRV